MQPLKPGGDNNYAMSQHPKDAVYSTCMCHALQLQNSKHFLDLKQAVANDSTI